MRARVELSFVRRFSPASTSSVAVPVRRVTKAARGRAIEEHGQAGDGTGSHRSVPVALVIVVVKMHDDHGEPSEPQVPDVRKSKVGCQKRRGQWMRHCELTNCLI